MIHGILADVFRAGLSVSAAIVMLFLPYAVTITRDRPDRTIHLLIGIELIMIGAMAPSLARWGQPLRMYGTPIVMAGAIWLSYYIYRAIRETPGSALNKTLG